MTPNTPDLIDLLGVIDIGARTHYDVFTAPTLQTPHGSTFGGQVIGQGIAAAAQTVPADRQIHSMHGYFMRPGDSSKRMTFEIARLFDGKSFSTRRSQAYQEGQVLMSLIASFQEEEEGLEHQNTFDMTTIPGPETLKSVAEKYGHMSENSRASWILNRPFDFRHVEGDIILDVEKAQAKQHVWMRSLSDMPDDPVFHAAGLAWASDYLLMEPVLRFHGIPWATAGFKGASLDHAMWFHRPFRIDEWMLYVLESPTSQNGRGFTNASFYDVSGNLVATVAQEVVLRVPKKG